MVSFFQNAFCYSVDIDFLQLFIFLWHPRREEDVERETSGRKKEGIKKRFEKAQENQGTNSKAHPEAHEKNGPNS